MFRRYAQAVTLMQWISGVCVLSTMPASELPSTFYVYCCDTTPTQTH